MLHDEVHALLLFVRKHDRGVLYYYAFWDSLLFVLEKCVGRTQPETATRRPCGTVARGRGRHIQVPHRPTPGVAHARRMLLPNAPLAPLRGSCGRRNGYYRKQ